MTTSKNNGFTLVEIAIVLIILGLIVGSVLGANSLIQSAKLQNQITDLTGFDQGANAFLLEYDYLPGDILRSEAVEYGIETSIYNNEYVHNGNGIINCHFGHSSTCGPFTNGISVMYYHLGEPAMFFIHMANAGLIDFSLSEPGANYAPNTNLPGMKVGDETRVITVSTEKNGNLNYLLGIQADINQYNNASFFGGISPRISRKIDIKLDDGIPNLGSVRAVNWSSGVALDTSSNCILNSGDNYNLSIDENHCTLLVKSGVAVR